MGARQLKPVRPRLVAARSTSSMATGCTAPGRRWWSTCAVAPTHRRHSPFRLRRQVEAEEVVDPGRSPAASRGFIASNGMWSRGTPGRESSAARARSRRSIVLRSHSRPIQALSARSDWTRIWFQTSDAEEATTASRSRSSTEQPRVGEGIEQGREVLEELRRLQDPRPVPAGSPRNQPLVCSRRGTPGRPAGDRHLPTRLNAGTRHCASYWALPKAKL